MKKASLCALLFGIIVITVLAGLQVSPANAVSTLNSVLTATPVLGGVIPGAGAPMPTCFPGKNCGDSSQQQIIAGEGAPMPTCFPGKNCGDGDQVRLASGLDVAERRGRS